MEIENKLIFRKDLIRVASGEKEADLLLGNCQLVNLFTEEIYNTNIAIYQGKIASISSKKLHAKKQIDCAGFFAVPGLIDGHIHIESTLLTPHNIAKVVLPKGVTTLLIDPHELANVSGIEGIRTFLKGIKNLPLRLLIQIPSRVPTAPGLETTGGMLGLEETKEMLTWDVCVSLGELDPAKVIPPVNEYIKKILLSEEQGKISVGHAAGLKELELDGYIAGGLRDDHEAVTTEEAIERLRRGLAIMIREGTAERNLGDLITLVTKMNIPEEYLFFCTDDKHINDIEVEGHIDFNIRKAVQAGVPPIKAIKMATINCARHFRLDHLIGCIAPGRFADIVLTESLSDFHANTVITNGHVVAEKNKFLGETYAIEWPDWSMNTVRVGTINPEKLIVNAKNSLVRIKVIELIENQIINRCIEADMPVVGGKVLSSPDMDILKIICVDRHTSSGTIGIGFVRGFNLKKGALGSSVAHDHHNIIVVGTNDEDILKAINTIQAIKGGFVSICDGEIVGKVELPLFGLMSLHSPEDLKKEMESINKAAHKLGCKLKSPFMTLGFISLPTVPDLGLTDKGLIDVINHEVVDIFV